MSIPDDYPSARAWMTLAGFEERTDDPPRPHSDVGPAMTSPAPDAPPVSPARKWAITVTAMVVAFMQILDTSVTNVVLPHLQGSLSAGLDEVSWVIASYLAANAVVTPATGWLVGLFGRRRVFLICAPPFVGRSVVSRAPPHPPPLVVGRTLQERAS